VDINNVTGQTNQVSGRVPIQGLVFTQAAGGSNVRQLLAAKSALNCSLGRHLLLVVGTVFVFLVSIMFTDGSHDGAVLRHRSLLDHNILRPTRNNVILESPLTTLSRGMSNIFYIIMEWFSCPSLEQQSDNMYPVLYIVSISLIFVHLV